MVADGGTEPSDGAAFTQSLSALKRRGSNLLVVGSPLTDVHGAACRRLLGEAETAPRRRLFVRTDGTSSCSHLPAEAPTRGTARVVTHATRTRSVAAAPSPGNVRVPSVTVREADLGSLAGEIVALIDEFDAASDGMEPGELRVCFDSLVPMLADHDEEDLFRLLHVVTVRVRQHRGMGHYHLPTARDDEHVDLLAPLFDAVIELRSSDDTPEHCWHILDRDLKSGWLPL